MGKIAFIDLREAGGAVYLLKGGAGETVALSIGEDGSLSTARPLEGIDEAFLSLPLNSLNFRMLELPFDEIDRIREVLPFEMDGIVLGGSGSVVFDARVMGRSNGKFKVLAVYAEKNFLKTLIERLKDIGADPKAVTSIELASLISSAKTPEEMAEGLLNPPAAEDSARMETALKEAQSPTIDLRRGELSYTLDTEKARRSLMVSAVLSLLILSFFAFDMGFRIITSKKEMSAINDGIRKAYLSAFPEEKKITNELYQMKAHIKELAEKERSYIGVQPLQLLLYLAGVSKPGVYFSEITADREHIVLKGECPTLSDVQAVKDGLSKFLVDVNISDAKPSGDKTRFTITSKGRKA